MNSQPTMPTKIASPLSPDEIEALDALGSLAVGNKHNSNLLADASDDGGRPLCLQFAAVPARASALRVALDVANGEKYRSALAKRGLTHIEFEVIRHKSQYFTRLFEAAKRVRDALRAADAVAGLDSLITQEGCDLNAKAVLFAVERLLPDRFGKVADGHAGGTSGPKNVYNIVIPLVQPCGNLAATPQNQPVIDIKSNE
ncbi:MAG: hypothetical protein ACI4QT_02995 [Kiritimatiellia bacterium]